jgi:hypothetical protein
MDYFYKGFRPHSLLAVFDIPDDDFRVFMYHTAFTYRETGQPSPYIDEFRWKIKGFKTGYKIMDRSGRVRGYLMGSRFLRYQFMVYEDRIGVRVRDYSNRVDNGSVPHRLEQTTFLPRRSMEAASAWLRRDRFGVFAHIPLYMAKLSHPTVLGPIRGGGDF